MSNHSKFRSLRVAALSMLLMFASPAFAGPPLLCHPFDLAGERSLPWGERGWNNANRDYDRSRLVADTLDLLKPQTPVLVRMETLRRAGIYAAADGAQMRSLAARLNARIAAAPSDRARAMALFDAGYFAETLQEVLRLQEYDMPGVGKVDLTALRAIVADGNGSRQIAQAVALQPQDSPLRFGAALVAQADQRRVDFAQHARLARSGAKNDRWLARNIGKMID